MVERNGKARYTKTVPNFLIFGLILFFLFAFILQFKARAAAPPTIISYQGKLLVNNLLATTTQNMYFILYDALTGGNAIYTASGTVGSPQPVSTTLNQGLFTMNLGDAGTNSLSPAIFGDNNSVYLEVRIGADTLSPRKRITSVPYAFNSKYLDGVGSATVSSSTYIPVSDANGNFTFNSTTITTSTISNLTVLSTLSLPSGSISSTDLASTPVVAGTFGSSTHVSSFTVDEDGRLTYASSTLISINANQVTAGILAIANGGTNSTTISSAGSVIFSNGTAYDATAVGNTGEILQSNGAGAPTWVTTSSLGLGSGLPSGTSGATLRHDGSNWVTSTFIYNDGYAVGINTSTPLATLSIQGIAGSSTVFDVASSTGSSMVRILASGNVGIGTTTPNQKLQVVGNISNIIGPNTSLSVVSTTGVGSGPYAVFVSGKYAYAANYLDNNISIIDVSNPSSPAQISTLTVGTNPISVYVSGRYAYVTNFNGTSTAVVDISNPKTPILVATTSVGTNPRSIYVSGRYAYIANHGSNDVSVVDISNPRTPVQVATTAVGINPISVYVSGRFAYIANYGSNSISIVDISDPTNPLQVATTSVGTNPRSIYVSGRYAYIANFTSNTVSIVDISNPLSPSYISTAPVGSGPFAIYVSGRYAYTSNYNDGTISAIDVSVPSSPVQVATTSVGLQPISLYVSGRYAYGTNYSSSSMFVVDLSGTEVSSLIAHSAEVGNIQSRNDVFAQGNIMAGTSLLVGAGGIMSNGALSVYASSTGATSSIFGIDSAQTSNIFKVFANGNISMGANNATTSIAGRFTVGGNSYLATISSGTWNGTAISNDYGGTGQDSSGWTGLVRVTAGTWATSTVDLVDDVTNTLAIARGGTNSTTISAAGSVIYSNGSAYFSTAVGNTGEILQSGGSGTPTWITTSSLGFAPASGSSNYIWLQSASSGTLQTGNLNISGTGLFGRSVGVGTTSPSATLVVQAAAGSSTVFDVASSSASSLFRVLGGGNVGIGSSTPSEKLVVAGNIIPNTPSSSSLGSIYMDSTSDVTLIGCNETSDYYASSVALAGDVNGDGYNDVVVGAQLMDDNGCAGTAKGAAFIYYGGPSMDTTADVTMNGAGTSDYFGQVVDTAGDVNGDGYADVIVGAPRNDIGESNVGVAYIYFGGPSMDSTFDVKLAGTLYNGTEGVGEAVAGGGDVNGDGYSDVILGYYSAAGGGTSRGTAHLFLGGPQLIGTISTTAANITFTTGTNSVTLGDAVAIAGDLNGDGYDDVVIGGPGAPVGGSYRGQAYVYYGGQTMDNGVDVVLSGGATNSDYFGSTLAMAGDVNNDGFDDVIVGAELGNSGETDNGFAILYYGGSTMNNTADVTISGTSANDNLGSAVASAGDINGDGYGDLIIGANDAAGGGTTRGQAYIFYGGSAMSASISASAANVTFNGPGDDANFGQTASKLGDINGDGFNDVIVGAPGWTTNTGEALIYHASPWNWINSITGFNYSARGLAAGDTVYGNKSLISPFLKINTSNWGITKSGSSTLRDLIIGNGDILIGTSTRMARLTVQAGAGQTPLDIASSTGASLLRVLANGNVGINTSSPLAALTIVNGSILAEGDTGSTPNSGAGTRMMWVPSKAAFRAGQVSGAQWDDANIGNSSVAIGYDAVASTSYSSAFGYDAVANGANNTFAAGESVRASGLSSAAFGYLTVAFGQYAFVAGQSNNATGNNSTVFGYANNAIGQYSTAFGEETNARGTYSTAFGYQTNANTNISTAFGSNTTASGTAATAFGNYITVKGNYSVGIGLDLVARTVTSSNVLAILGGNVGIGSSSPSFLLSMEASGGGYYDAVTHQWTNGSLRSIKQDISPITESERTDLLGMLDNLNVNKYRFISDYETYGTSSIWQYGLIADESPDLLTGHVKAGIQSGSAIQFLITNLQSLYRKINTTTFSFSTTTLLESLAGNSPESKAFILNAPNFNDTDSDKYILSLRSNNTSVFSVSANGDLITKGTISGASLTLGTSTNPGDLAERVDIAIDDNVEPGDVMIIDQNSPDTYRRSRQPYEQSVAGIISTNPTIIVGNGKTDYTAVMAMVGRVPVKVSNENGNIQRGDLLISATMSGYAMKYDPTRDNNNKMVAVIGVALEPLTEPTGKILSLIRTGWIYNRDQTITDIQNNIQQLANTQGINLSPDNNPENLFILESPTTGNLNFTNNILDLQNGSIINVAGIEGKDGKWRIDGEGSLIVKVQTTEGEKEVYAMQSQSMEVVFSSSSQLINGEVMIAFENSMKEIIDSEKPLKISVTLTSDGGSGVFVASKSVDGFVVRELNGGKSNATFDWIVVASRQSVQTMPVVPEQVPETVPPTPIIEVVSSSPVEVSVETSTPISEAPAVTEATPPGEVVSEPTSTP